MYPILIVYFTNHNEFKVRFIYSSKYSENDVTSMGWKIITIRYYYNGYFISKKTYQKKLIELSEKRYQKLKRKNRIKKILECINVFFK